MFQSSIKKITKRLVIVSMAMCAGLWFAGCGSKEEEQKSEDPLNVSGGEVTKGGGKEYANAPVTAANLDDFLVMFRSTFYSDLGSKSGSAARDKRDNRPAEFDKGKDIQKGTYKKSGDSSGYFEAAGEGGYGLGETSSYEFKSMSYKFFDFSNTNTLFLGGAYGNVAKSEDFSATRVRSDSTVLNGKIDFQGAFKGKIVFDNISSVIKYTEEEIQGEMGTEYKKNIIDSKKSGSFYVESNGQKIKLPDSLLWKFSYPNSNKGGNYGDDGITLARPAVPAAPSGNLTERAGAAVSADNSVKFFSAFKAELAGNKRGYNNAPRAAIEETKNFERLIHGEVSGYVLKKEDYKSQDNNSGEHSAGTETMKYDDYSNESRLYFGGGFGKSKVGVRKYTKTPTFSETKKDTIIINGKVKFNGEFKGELDFQNFKFAFEYLYPNSDDGGSDRKYNVISGNVMIGEFNATDLYVKYVLKDEYIDQSEE